MSVTASAVYRHDGLAYQMIVTETGGRPQDKDVEIEYLGHPQRPPSTSVPTGAPSGAPGR